MADYTRLSTEFSKASRLLVRDGGWRRLESQFDLAQKEFEDSWKVLYTQFEKHPQDTAQACKTLIESQELTTALTFAVAKTNSKDLFPRLKRHIELVLRSTNSSAGYVSVNAIPHTLAGFLYMSASTVSLMWEGWDVLQKLLQTKFEWYYQSGRPLFNYGFDLSYFFHSEAVGRSAPHIHDLFRSELLRPELRPLLLADKEEIIDAYIQVQMLMALKVAQTIENGGGAAIWPDFGRFYADRVVKLLDRIYENSEYSVGILRAFGETKEAFFSRINERLMLIRSNFWSHAPFMYESVVSWEPREHHR